MTYTFQFTDVQSNRTKVESNDHSTGRRKQNAGSHQRYTLSESFKFQFQHSRRLQFSWRKSYGIGVPNWCISLLLLLSVHVMLLLNTPTMSLLSHYLAIWTFIINVSIISIYGRSPVYTYMFSIPTKPLCEYMSSVRSYIHRPLKNRQLQPLRQWYSPFRKTVNSLFNRMCFMI